MKKLLGILVLGLLLSSNAFAEKNITGFKKIKKSMPLKKVDRIKTVKKSDGFPVYEGETSIQVTVNREDAGCGKFDSTDKGHRAGACDGKYNRSRQEYVLGNEKSKLKNKEYIYEWAMYFDENYESLKYNAQVIMVQMHTAPTKKCSTNSTHFWLFDTRMKGEQYYVFGSRSGISEPVQIGKINDLKGKWTHIKLHILYKLDNTGRYLIYKNNELIGDLKNIKTLADKCDAGYLKVGIYRWNHIGYFNNKKWEELPDQTVYYDSIKLRKPKKEEKIKNK